MLLSLPSFHALRCPKTGRALALLPALLALLAAPAAPAARAQTPTWQTVNTPTSGSNATDYPTILESVPDGNGNVLVAGTFQGRVSFGNTTLVSAGYTDGFVAKYNPTTDTYLWAERLGTAAPDNLTGLAVSGTSVYVVGGGGGTSSSTTFTIGTQGQFTLSNDTYVVKFTDAGTSLTYGWGQAVQSTSTNSALGVAVSGSNVYIIGQQGSATDLTFGSLTLALGSSGYVAKLVDAGSSGSWLWAKPVTAYCADIAAVGSAIYFTGYIYYSGRFDTNTLTADTYYGYQEDLFVARLTDNGATATYSWVLSDGDRNNNARGKALTVANGNVYVVGSTSGSQGFGQYYSGGVYNAFIWKMGTSGYSQWQTLWRMPGFGSPTLNELNDVAVTGADIFVSGIFGGSTTSMGSATATNGGNTLNAPSYDGFVGKVIDRGTTFTGAWALGLGAAGDDFARTLSVVGSKVYVGGTVVPPAQFSAITITSSNTTQLGFIAGLQATLTPAVVSISPSTGGAGTLVTLTGNNLTGATALTLNGVGITGFTVVNATTITFTVPVGATTGAIGVTVPSGPAVSTVGFTVVYPPTVSSLSPNHGVAGTTVVVNGSSLNGATAVALNGTALSGYTVNTAGTQLTLTLPAGVSTGDLAVTTPTGTSQLPFTVDVPTAGPILLDGYRESRYGAAQAVQTSATGVGNAVNGSQTTALLGSELDAAYTYVHGDSLYVFLAGNLQNNGSTVDIFFDTQTGGQNILANNNPNVDNGGLNAMAGLRFDTNFAADYMMSVKARVQNGVIDTYFATLGTGGTSQNPASTGAGRVVTMNLGSGRTGTVAVDMSNTGGVSATTVDPGTPEAVVTGIEFVLPLAAIGAPAGSLKIAAFINNASHDFLSNQVLGALPAGTTNLGNPLNVNFNNVAGNQYFTTTLPAVPTQVSTVSPASGAVGSTVTITGAGFTGATSVSFNGVSTTAFTVTSPTTITVTVPAGATAGLVSVTAPGGVATSATSFCVQYTPAATAASRCGAGSLTLTATGAPTGGTYAFYSAATGGTPLGSGASFNTASLNGTTTFYVGISTGSGANACEGPRTPVVATINQVPTTAISASGPLSFCPGGSVTLTATGADTYRWSTGATTPTITVSQSGSYSVTGTNTTGGCTAVSAATQVTVNPAATASITAGGPTSFCQGGSVTLTANGGGTYLWSTGATTPTITVSQSGSYSVTATNASGCSATSAPTTVTANPLAVANAGTAATFCSGGSAQLGASAVAGYTYSWSPATGLSSATAANPSVSLANASNAPTTITYTLTATTASGCSATSTVAVTVNPAATASIAASGPTSFCQGGSVTLTASGGGTYRWSTGATTQSISVSQSGSYSVTATNASGCSATSAPTTVTANPLAVANAGAAATFCSGSSAQLGASAVAGYTYSWSPATGLSSATAANPSVSLANASSAPTTITYTLTATTASGCSATSTVAVTVNPAATASIAASGPTSFCQGGSVTLAASGGGTYRWSNGATTPTINVSQGGSYTVTATNASGCSATSAATTVVVNAIPAQPTFTQTVTSSGIILTSSAPTGNQWYLDGVLIPGATGNTYTVSSRSMNGTYTVVTTSAAGCASPASVGTLVLGTAPQALMAQVQLYPNPTRGQFIVQAPAPARVRVLNALGQVVATKLAASTTQSLDLTGLASGVYAVQVQLGSDVVVKRIVLE
ncbi:T9SS type A sorting domain-containing protein [Microvirga sp. STS02]|uniref:beta strand repeat-containing protein n=1 Tax=Hymenobacter negativus TaxID=2795026 RepID=UPI0018DDAF51|nr:MULTISPECIES: T9SS type A sorting domain-containing protein [Bacteria]MBH8568435.1 T9SS type A sorting domain-containing protein [Hymenobacter negativus]MBR7208170.1 T9SS type A sorting domain-containing protein [Microvirga sp. STS02]